MGYFLLLGVIIIIGTWGRVLLGDMSKNKQNQFFDSNVFFSNLNAMNMKLFCNHGAIYMFEEKFKIYSGEINLLGVHRNMRWCTLEVNFEGLGW